MNDIYMPQLSLTMTDGKVVNWLKKEGDPVKKGEPVVEVETDKATVELEAPADGILGSIVAPVGAVVPIGGQLSIVLDPDSRNYLPERNEHRGYESRHSPGTAGDCFPKGEKDSP